MVKDKESEESRCWTIHLCCHEKMRRQEFFSMHLYVRECK